MIAAKGERVREGEAAEADDADSSLVRPYIASLTEIGPIGTRSRFTEADEPTALMPILRQPSRLPADHTRRPRRISERTRFALIAGAIVVLIGSVAGGYLAWDPGGDKTAVFPAPVPLVLPSQPPTPAPSAISHPAATSPAPARTTARAVVTARPQRTPSPSAAPQPATSTASAAPHQVLATNLAAGRPVTDTGHADVYVASNAVDGDPDTYWESRNNAFPQSIAVDLGAPMTVGRVVLRLPPLAAWGKRTETLSIVGSTDGRRYTTVVRSASPAFDPATGNMATIAFPAATWRFIGLVFTANTAWPAGQVSEIEIYAS